MATAETPTHNILTVLPEREEVCLRPGAVLDSEALRRLEDEARALLRRGFAQLTIDLRKVKKLEGGTAATLAAISRCARRGGAGLSLIPGNSPTVREVLPAVRELVGAELAQDHTMETPAPRPFLDWSR